MNARDYGAAARARNNEAKRQELIEEIEFMLEANLGEAGLLEAVGYRGKPDALQVRLRRAGRHDLIPRIFEWQTEIEDRYHPKKAA